MTATGERSARSLDHWLGIAGARRICGNLLVHRAHILTRWAMFVASGAIPLTTVTLAVDQSKGAGLLDAEDRMLVHGWPLR